MAKAPKQEISQKAAAKLILEKEPDLKGQPLADKLKAEFGITVNDKAAGVLRSQVRSDLGLTTPRAGKKAKAPKAAPMADVATDIPAPKAASTSSNGSISLEKLHKAAAFVKEMGGVADTLNAIQALAGLQV